MLIDREKPRGKESIYGELLTTFQHDGEVLSVYKGKIPEYFRQHIPQENGVCWSFVDSRGERIGISIGRVLSIDERQIYQEIFTYDALANENDFERRIQEELVGHNKYPPRKIPYAIGDGILAIIFQGIDYMPWAHQSDRAQAMTNRIIADKRIATREIKLKDYRNPRLVISSIL